MKLLSACLILPLLSALLLTSCSSTGGAASNSGSSTTARTGQRVDPNHPLLKRRNAEIAQEPLGDYYIGRRYWIEGTRFWGFVRKPRQPWHHARLVMINESKKLTPDRVSEETVEGPRHGYDHNYEYKIVGSFTGAEVYDPNSNQVLPEFMLEDYELISSNAGFLFHPNQRFEKNRIPRPPSGL